MDLILSLINITKSWCAHCSCRQLMVGWKGSGKGNIKGRGGGVEETAYLLFFHFSRTIKISVLHACLTHTVRRPPPLFPLSAGSVEMHLPISISLTSITYTSPSPPLLIRPTHSKLAAAITGNIKHRLRWAPSDRYHTDHRQTPTVTGIIIVGNDHTRERAKPRIVGAPGPRYICCLPVCAHRLARKWLVCTS